LDLQGFGRYGQSATTCPAFHDEFYVLERADIERRTVDYYGVGDLAGLERPKSSPLPMKTAALRLGASSAATFDSSVPSAGMPIIASALVRGGRRRRRRVAANAPGDH
jgi:hypothetical protein